MNAPLIDRRPSIETPANVYAPTDDSWLLIDTFVDMMHREGFPGSGRVLDLCTGSGVLAIAAASAGATSVTAVDIGPAAVRCARENAQRNRVAVDVVHGDLDDARARAPFDVVLCNPPYVPGAQPADTTSDLALAWNAGPEGRAVIDPVCEASPSLLAPGGTMLMVHSALSNTERTLAALRDVGLRAAVVARRRIPFGPVLTARARWLESHDLVASGTRTEELVVVRADRD